MDARGARSGRSALSLLALVVLASAFAVLAVSVAEAAQTLHTAAQFRAGRFFDCRVVNAGTRNATVMTYVVNSEGFVEAMNVNEVIAPDTVGGVSVGTASGGNILFCKVVATVGNKTLLRGSYCVAEVTTGVCTATGDAR